MSITTQNIVMEQDKILQSLLERTDLDKYEGLAKEITIIVHVLVKALISDMVQGIPCQCNMDIFYATRFLQYITFFTSQPYLPPEPNLVRDIIIASKSLLSKFILEDIRWMGTDTGEQVA